MQLTGRGLVGAVAISWLAALVLQSAQAQPDLLLTEDRIRREAVLIGGIVNNHIRQAIFPDIKFTCPGNLTKWYLAAVPVLGGTRYPEVHVWRRGASAREFVRYKRNKLSDDSPNPVGRVYEATRNPPLRFEAGDILGVYNPTVPALSFRYQRNGGPRGYFIVGEITARENINLDGTAVAGNGNDYPLVAVTVEPEECASGFLDYSSLVLKASLLTGTTSNLDFRDSIQRVIPALEFPEAGLIHNITVGGVWDYSHTELPEIQVWTATGQGSWRKSASVSSNTDITPNIALNVHRYTPFTPLDVRAGDILGYYQPSDGRSLFQIYHIPGGPDNYLRRSSSPLDTVSQQENTEDALPLITVGFTPTGSDPTTTPHPYTPSSTYSTSPAQSSNSSSVVVVVVVVVAMAMCLVLAVASAVAAYVRWYRRRQPGPYSRATPHHYDVTAKVGPRRFRPPPSTRRSSGQMEYNVNYLHKDPSVVITDGRKKTVSMAANSAYDSESFPNQEEQYPGSSNDPPSQTVRAVNPRATAQVDYEEVSVEN